MVQGTDERHNGWTNYETWLVALWLDNDPGLHSSAMDLARQAEDYYQCSNAIKEWIEEINPLGDETGLFSDLLSGALREVNWEEIAERLLSKIEDD